MDPKKIEILAIYKYLEQVVIFRDETGEICVRAFVEDQGTEEEQKVIKELLMSQGFKINNTKTVA